MLRSALNLQLTNVTWGDYEANPYPGWVTSDLAIVKMWRVIGCFLEPASKRLTGFLPMSLHCNEEQIKDQTQVWLVKFKDWCQPLSLWGLSHRQAITPTLPWPCVSEKTDLFGKRRKPFLMCVRYSGDFLCSLMAQAGIRASLDLGSTTMT